MPSSDAPFYGALVVSFLALYLSPSKHRQLLFPVILCLVVYILIFTSTKPPISNLYTGLHASLILLHASDFILLTPNLHHTLQRRPNDRPSPQAPKTRTERFLWALDLSTNPRGINWSFQAPELRRSSLPRWAFVRSQLLWAAVFYVVKDAMYTHNRLNPSFQPNGAGMSADGWAWRIWNGAAFWMTFASGMLLNTTMMGVVCVASGMWEPRDCPFFFGRWWKTTGVRSFWGRTWHQMLRRGLSSHGKYVANRVLRFSSGSLLSSYTQLFVAFFLSGVAHAAAEWMLSHDVTSTLHVVRFYVAQAVGVMAEDGVIACGKKLGLRDCVGVRALGALWVLLWMGWSGPLWMDPTIRGGVLIAEGPKISVIGGFWNGEWKGIGA